MEFLEGPGMIVAIIALTTIGWLVNNWIRAKHGYPLEDELFGKSEKLDTESNKRLEEQNKQLLETMEKMQDRMIVLERIVTDKGYSVAQEIEALRDAPPARDVDNGVPLNFDEKERV